MVWSRDSFHYFYFTFRSHDYRRIRYPSPPQVGVGSMADDRQLLLARAITAGGDVREEVLGRAEAQCVSLSGVCPRRFLIKIFFWSEVEGSCCTLSLYQFCPQRFCNIVNVSRQKKLMSDKKR